MADSGSMAGRVDLTRPSIARVYDYMLGGKDNFAVDREVVRLAFASMLEARKFGLANRAFLRRALRHLVRHCGIRQFLDLGSGLPTRRNVHEIVHEMEPRASVVYVDHDPMVLAHARALLTGTDQTIVVGADLRTPSAILGSGEVRRVLDFGQPVGLLLGAILHHINDDEQPGEIVAQLRAALASGSHIVISHFHDPGDRSPEAAADVIRAEKVFAERLGAGRWRTREEIYAFFGGYPLLDPGLVPVQDWRPEPETALELSRYLYHGPLGGVARKP